MKKKPASRRGGARPGAGRPRKDGKALSIRLPVPTVRWLQTQTYGPQGDVIDHALRRTYKDIGDE